MWGGWTESAALLTLRGTTCEGPGSEGEQGDVREESRGRGRGRKARGHEGEKKERKEVGEGMTLEKKFGARKADLRWSEGGMQPKEEEE